MSCLCSGSLASRRGVCFPTLCAAAGGEEAEFAAGKCDAGPSATVLLCFTVSWILPGCSSTARGWAHCGGAASVRKEQQKSRCGGAAGAPCCRSPPCRQRNACFDSCHGNKFILRPGERLAAMWQGGQEPVQPCGIPRRTREGRRDGVGFSARKMLCQLQNSGCWFPTPKGQASCWAFFLGS